MKRITLEHDDANDEPDFGWKVYSFSTAHRGWKDPDTFVMPDDPEDATALQKEVAEKLKVGLAFYLSYYEHGNCVWSLRGQGPSDRFDSRHTAGILIYDEDYFAPAETLESRAEMAALNLETYTCWANGEMYGYSIATVTNCDKCGHEIVKDNPDASCWGFYGHDIACMASEVREALGDTREAVEVVGDASFLADTYDFGHRVVVNSKRPDDGEPPSVPAVSAKAVSVAPEPSPQELAHESWDRFSVAERDAFSAGVGSERVRHTSPAFASIVDEVAEIIKRGDPSLASYEAIVKVIQRDPRHR